MYVNNFVSFINREKCRRAELNGTVDNTAAVNVITRPE